MLPAQIKLRQLLATKLEKTSFFSSSTPARKNKQNEKKIAFQLLRLIWFPFSLFCIFLSSQVKLKKLPSQDDQLKWIKRTLQDSTWVPWRTERDFVKTIWRKTKTKEIGYVDGGMLLQRISACLQDFETRT